MKRISRNKERVSAGFHVPARHLPSGNLLAGLQPAPDRAPPARCCQRHWDPAPLQSHAKTPNVRLFNFSSLLLLGDGTVGCDEVSAEESAPRGPHQCRSEASSLCLGERGFPLLLLLVSRGDTTSASLESFGPVSALRSTNCGGKEQLERLIFCRSRITIYQRYHCLRLAGVILSQDRLVSSRNTVCFRNWRCCPIFWWCNWVAGSSF